MAELTIASEETRKMVKEVAFELGLTQSGVEFEVFCTKKAKEIIQIQKANAVSKALTNKEMWVSVIVYEDAFNKVDEKEAYLWLRTAMMRISYDSEKEKVHTSCPMINIPLEAYSKYGNVVIQNAELGLHVINILREEEKQRKADEKAAKAEKKKKKNY